MINIFMKEQVVKWLNRVLVADVFFVILSFAWFAIAVIGKSTGVALGLDLWLKLWQPVFNPAIGILMAGALLNWLINKIHQKLNSNS
jgi:hypothetical protein